MLPLKSRVYLTTWAHMTDTSPGSGHADAVSEPVGDWLEEVAQSEGLSKEEAVEELLSAYWQLMEIAEVFDGRPGPTEPSDSTANDPDNVQPESGDDNSDLEPRIAELSKRIERLEQQTAPSSLRQTSNVEDVSHLLTRLNDLEGFAATLEAEVDDIGEIAVHTKDYQAFKQISKSFQESITNRQDRLQEQIRPEFENIRTILEHLLDRTDSNEARVERVISRFESHLDSRQAEREKLVSISQKAIEQGVDVADCDHCSLAINLAKLRTPVCPHCGYKFDDLKTTSQLVGLWNSHVLTGGKS